MMAADPNQRLSAKEALQHPWILKYTQSSGHGEADGPPSAPSSSVAYKGESCIVM